ncbi:MAG: DUF4150 domain-containing protein [Myxococcota bacterium]
MSFPLSTRGGGQLFAFPNVCKTPTPAGPTPLPYPSTGSCTQAKKESKKVSICNQAALTVASEIPRTQGDEAGTALGVMSNTHMGKAVFKEGSKKIRIEGKPVALGLKPTAHNGSNTNAPMGLQVSPSQLKVFAGT